MGGNQCAPARGTVILRYRLFFGQFMTTVEKTAGFQDIWISSYSSNRLLDAFYQKVYEKYPKISV